jgi:hypothetical protein
MLTDCACRWPFPWAAPSWSASYELSAAFQLVILRQQLPHVRRLLVGGVYVVIGLALFLAGLEKVLFPLGIIPAMLRGRSGFIFPALFSADNCLVRVTAISQRAKSRLTFPVHCDYLKKFANDL